PHALWLHVFAVFQKSVNHLYPGRYRGCEERNEDAGNLLGAEWTSVGSGSRVGSATGDVKRWYAVWYMD
ncbi:MAG: hypothetical protein QXJ64_08945, partial [Thermosphaera sp.]